MRVLAVGAHPDDLELLAAGTLARYANAGHHVAMCVLTDGDLGSDELDRSTIAYVRRAEAADAAAEIGAELHLLGEPDGFLFDRPDLRRAVVEVFRQTRPDVVITHSPQDYHPDHRATSQIVLNCRQLGGCRLLTTTSRAHRTIPAVLFMDTLGGIDFHPELWIDITDVIELKRRMLRRHRSQNDWLRRLHGVDYVSFVDTLGAMRGMQCGTAYAEGFRIAHGYPEPVDAAALLPTSSQPNNPSTAGQQPETSPS